MVVLGIATYGTILDPLRGVRTRLLLQHMIA